MKTKTQVKVRELSALEHYSQLTGPEACRLFGISRTTLWKWVKAGRIPEPRWRLGEPLPLLEALPKMSDVLRGLKAQQGEEDSATTEKPAKKSHNVWERLGLSSPKG